MNEHLPSRFTRHQAHEMFYSVIWSTDDTVVKRGAPIDLAEKKESWLAKLGSWTEALAVYEQKLANNPRDFEAILGCMRCLDASGEWRRVLELAEKSWPALSGSTGLSHSLSTNMQDPPPTQSSVYISARSQKKALRLCAQAAWRLGHWDDLEKFATQLNNTTAPTIKPAASPGIREGIGSRVDFDGSFFSGKPLALHCVENHVCNLD